MDKSKYEITNLLKNLDDRDNSVELGTRAQNIIDLLYLKEQHVNSILDYHEIETVLKFKCEYDGNLYV